jgi:LmbE family N-acetylglucosaminyl deacetylase
MEWKKYAYTFLITAVIFITAILASNYFSQKKINEIQNIESQISVDILSSETQFSLLSELSCGDISNSFLSKELADLGDKLSYLEESRGVGNAEVINLKKYYSLLEIKDYLLVNKIGRQCPHKLIPVLFFYSASCPKCDDQGYVLTRMRQDYEQLRIYSFDYNIDASAVQTLASIYKISSASLPALVINSKTYSGIQYVSDIEKIIPEIQGGNHLDIIISPHFDDAVLSLGGSMAAFPGSPIMVTVFAGMPNPDQKDAYWDKMSGFSDSNEAIAARTKENVNASAIYNAKTINLKYQDSQYRSGKDDNIEQSVVRDIENIIKENNKPGVSINIYGPAIFDLSIEHPDHLIAHEALMGANKDFSNMKNLRFFMYEDYPYAEKSAKQGKESILNTISNKYRYLDFEEIPVILSDKDLGKKEEAIKKYSSQIAAFKEASLDLTADIIDWNKNRCKDIISYSSACEVIYEIRH